ncbi:DUF4232 domain-containing protein [Actinoplanes sp. TFC3]|uniref:DUF4232 domain-containing protein n=1 Tax=Actinoplanes sp. TFC3 TaxID=1710355 RepID=UPI00082A37FD|nr:DUF4232 domain-containing protein [Actinoplanes sp. TFC3]
MRVPVLAVTTGLLLAAGATVASVAHAATVPGRCSAVDLTVAVHEGDMYSKGAEYFENLRIELTNMTTTSCVLDGTPAVELTGPAGGSFDRSYSLPHSGTAPLLTLTSGTTAPTTVRVHVLPDAQDAWQPQRMRITPPGATGAVTVDWPEGLTILQEKTELPGLGLPNRVEPAA